MDSEDCTFGQIGRHFASSGLVAKEKRLTGTKVRQVSRLAFIRVHLHINILPYPTDCTYPIHYISVDCLSCCSLLLLRLTLDVVGDAGFAASQLPRYRHAPRHDPTGQAVWSAASTYRPSKIHRAHLQVITMRC
jgi:hypothetical protein